MIRVEKPTFDDDPQWVDLRRRAEDAQRELMATFHRREPIKVNDNLYKEFKPWLERVYRKKCAYCENTIVSQHGDVEHYRPKNRVSDIGFVTVWISDPRDGTVIPHYGYFWLAYDWDNLLLSCVSCNQKRRVAESGTEGKGDRFPIKGKYMVDWTANTEQALLLNPSDSAFAADDHLVVELDEEERPFLRAVTEEGEITVTVFGLNRGDLLELRSSAYASAVGAIGAYFDAIKARNLALAKTRRDRVNRLWRGDEPFTIVHRAALRAVQAQWAEGGFRFDLPIPERP